MTSKQNEPGSGHLPVPSGTSSAPLREYTVSYPQYTVVHADQNVQWGHETNNIVVVETADDIIQKSLAMSGLSQEVIQGQKGEPIVLELRGMGDKALTQAQTVDAPNMQAGMSSISRTNSMQQQQHDTPDIPEAVKLRCVEANQNIPEVGSGVITKAKDEALTSEAENSEIPVAEDDGPATCDTCGEEFENDQALVFHMREHMTNCLFECASCNALFRIASELQKHVKTCKMVAKSRPYPCEYCDKAFFKKSAYKRHLVSHGESRERFPCEVCDKTFSSVAYLKKHKFSHESPPPKVEKVKNRKDDGVAEDIELEIEDEKENQAEDDSDRRDPFRSLRKRPSRASFADRFIDTDEEFEDDFVQLPKPQKPKVGKIVARVRKPKVTQEKRIKLGKVPKHMMPKAKKPLKCGKCEMCFENGEDRSRHVQTHAAMLTEKEHMCMICGKTYTMSCNLERHSLVHTNTRLHRCDICGKGFHRVDILDRHRRIHTGEKPHACNQCDMRFVSAASLNKHKKTVHEDKAFRCEKCPDSFHSDKLLERHMRSHDPSRRFSCDKCGKCFINSSNLKTHMRIHTKEKPFVCDHCGERFTQKAHVERHIITHTRPAKTVDIENPPLNADAIQQFVKQLYYCSTCNKSFPKRRGLRMHERMRHGLGTKAKLPKLTPTSANSHSQSPLNTLQLPPPPPNQLQQHPNTWYPPMLQHQQVPQPLNQQPQSQPQPLQQQQQQPLQYTLPMNQVQQCTVYNTSNGNVFTQQYVPQGLNQQFDIQIQQPMNQDEPVVFTAADSHDTIMYLIEAAASSNMINQPLQHQSQIQAQVIHPQQFQHNGSQQRYGEMTIVQQGPSQHQVLQQPQLQLQQPQPQPALHQEIVSSQKTKRPKMEKNTGGPKPYKCPTCNECFASSGVLIKHIRTHTGEKPYHCQHCGKCFTQIGNLHRHVKSHQGIRNHRCHICGKSFTRRERLLYHLKLHSGEKNFKCGECGKEFMHKANLMSHYNRRHSEYRPFGCPDCGKSFAEKRALKVHRRIHDERNLDKSHVCLECGRGFCDPIRLAKHSRIHSDLRPHRCEQCNKAYTLATSLRNHMTYHHAPRVADGAKAECPTCHKKYPTRTQLLAHIRIHGPAKYECEVCHKKFVVSSNLTNHMRIHSGEKPFKCDKCGQAFTQRGHLLRHAKGCNRKSYGCQECEFTFTNLPALSRHITKMHGLPTKKRFPCDQCDLHFSSALSLQKHIKISHADQVTPDEIGSDDDGVMTIQNEAEDLSASYKCKKCKDRFENAEELESHSEKCEVEPLKEPPQKIPKGPKKLAVSRGRKAATSKPFKCATCSTCFATIAQLRNHTKKHFAPLVKKFCSKCGGKYSCSTKEHSVVCTASVVDEATLVEQSAETMEEVEEETSKEHTADAGGLAATAVVVDNVPDCSQPSVADHSVQLNTPQLP